ncbi:lipopolysaccharide biosynthesis protein, partial [Streptomyces albidoflavus]
VSTVVVAVACGVFLLTLDWWGPSYAPLGTLSAGLFFTASSIGWALLTLQDGVLTGLRQAIWVPVGNAVFTVGKMVLLILFATALPVLGVFVSWSAAIALSVLPIGWLVLRRLIPRQAHADRDREPPGMREIGRFMAGDSVGAFFSLIMINLLPVMVAVRFDAAHNAFFYTAYTLGGTMEFMAINMATSLTAHASHSPESLAEGVRGALRRMTLLLVPVVLVLVVFAPLVLAPFGGAYAEQGTTVLRLLAAAALPRVAVELYIGVLRVQGRTGVLAAFQGAMCVLVLGSAALLLGPFGIAGAGYAVLGAMTLMALVSVPGLRAALNSHAPAEEPKRAARVRERAEDDYGTSWARESAYLRGAHESVTPAFGIPVYVPRPRPEEPVGPSVRADGSKLPTTPSAPTAPAPAPAPAPQRRPTVRVD